MIQTKKILWLVAIVGLVGGSAVHARDGRDCVEAYRQANSEYFKRIAQIDDAHRAAAGMASVATLGWVGCLWATKGSIVGCTAVSAGAVSLSAYYSYRQSAEAKRLSDARRLYQIYVSFKEGQNPGSPEAQTFLQDTRVDVQKENQVLGELAREMDSGELCRKGSLTKSYAEVVSDMRDYDSAERF
jgi:hypothetical protein